MFFERCQRSKSHRANSCCLIHNRSPNSIINSQRLTSCSIQPEKFCLESVDQKQVPHPLNRKNPKNIGFLLYPSGFIFVWRLPIFAFTLSSAFNGLTSVFEMGTCVTHWLSSPYGFLLYPSGFIFVWRLPIFAFTLSSAFNGLTSVFEMGTCVTHWLSSPYRSVLRLNHLIMDLSKTNTSFDITLVSNSYDFTSFMKSRDCLWLSFPLHDSYCQSFRSVSRYLRLSFRPISTGQLHYSRNFHPQPISL